MSAGHRHWSLRARLTAAATVVVAVAVSGAAALLVWRVETKLVADLDLAATRQAIVVAASTAQGGAPAIAASEAGDTAVQVVNGSGGLIASSPNIEGEPRLFDFPATPPTEPPAIRTVVAVPLGENSDYRVAAVAGGRAGADFTVYVGLPLAPVRQTVTALTTSLLFGVPLFTTLLGTMTWLLVGRALRPVENLRRQAADISDRDFGRRLEVPQTGDELSRLAATINEMLARLDSSVTRQREFVADAAHELRSPVASIRAQLEVAEAHAAADDRAAAQILAADSRRLSLLVDDLLALARLDAHPVPRNDVVDLDDVVLDELASLRLRTSVEIDISGLSGARVLGDRGMLARAARNVLDNAARYASLRVWVRLAASSGVVTLVVADDGPGIAPDDRQRVLERFTRLDGSRGRDAGGVGLGLAIVHDVVEAHGGRVTIGDNHPGTLLAIVLPSWREDLPSGAPAITRLTDDGSSVSACGPPQPTWPHTATRAT